MLYKSKIYFISYFLLFTSFFYSQINLVPNPSFETYTTCPSSVGQLSISIPWFSPSSATPDYYNICAPLSSYVGLPTTFFGNCNSRSGNAMSGFLLTEDVSNSFLYREYFAVKLTAILTNGIKYYFTCYLRLSDSSRYSSDEISVLFRNDSISKSTSDTIDAVPQISNPNGNYFLSKTNWTKWRGSFVSSGNEKYMYIGNFKSTVTNDTLFVLGGGRKQYFNYPYYFIEDLCLSDDSLFCENLFTGINTQYKRNTNIYPNPATDQVFIKFDYAIKTIELYDVFGNEVKIGIKVNKNIFSIDIHHLPEGIYFLQLNNQKYKLLKTNQ